MDSEARGQKLEKFVESYFQDLQLNLQKVKNDLEAVEERLATRLGALAKASYMREVLQDLESAHQREMALDVATAALQALGSARGEEEALNALLSHARKIAPRVLVFVRKGDQWILYGPSGLDAANGFSIAEDNLCRRAAEERATVAGEATVFPSSGSLRSLLGESKGYCAAIPLIFGESVPAVVYLDAPTGERLDVRAVELLCQGARMAIRSLRFASRAVSQAASAGAREERAAPSEIESAPAKTPVPVPSERGEGAGSRFGTVETGVISDYRIDFSSQAGADPAIERALIEPLEGTAITNPFEVGGSGDGGSQQATQSTAEPERGLPEKEVPPALTEEEERQHADARRFARLLVSELKLYNEQAVVEGRRSADIYSRLKSDIDRSREMYSRRVPQSVTRHSDHFHEELVKLLAEGDHGALGRDYPGPQGGTEL